MLRCALAIFMARGEEVTPTKIGWACAARFLKPLFYLWPKFAFSPSYFTTWPRIWYPVKDLIPCFGSLVQPDVKGIVKGFCWWSYRYRWKRSFIWKNVPNSRLECKNHTLIETKNGQGLHTSQVAHQAGAYPGFCGTKRLRIFLLPPGWDACPSQGYPQH